MAVEEKVGAKTAEVGPQTEHTMSRSNRVKTSHRTWLNKSLGRL